MGIKKDKTIVFWFTKTFQKEIRKFAENHKNLKNKINHCIDDFVAHTFDSIYYRKPLRNGIYKDFHLHELELGGDFRIIIQFIEEQKHYKCYFINFWNHASLNLSSDKRLNIHPVRE